MTDSGSVYNGSETGQIRFINEPYMSQITE